MRPSGLDMLTPASRTTFSMSKQLSIDVVCSVWSQFQEDLLKQNHVILVVLDHFLNSFFLASKHPQPEFIPSRYLLSESEISS